MKINNNKESSQAKRDYKRNQKPDEPKPLFTNFKSKLVSSSSVNMNKKRLTGVLDPKLDVDPINFRYLQENFVPKTSISNRAKSSIRFLPIRGGKMSGDINMGGNKVVDLPTPTTRSSKDTAVTVGYVNSKANEVALDPKVIEKIKELSELSKELEVIEEALGVKPISPDTPPQREKEKSSKLLCLSSIKAAA